MKNVKINLYKEARNGFTLIEVALVILIGGILLAGTGTLLMNYMQQTQMRTTERRIQVIDEALQLYLDLNGRYPCAAPANAPVDDPDFGVEFASCDTATAAPGGRGGRDVRIGVVPVRTLNLPDDLAGDAWGNRFTYAVTEALAVDGTYNRTEGAIFVRDSAGNEIVNDPDDGPGTAHYVVLSHGRNGVGATSLGGVSGLPCDLAALEGENCNGDAIFRSTLLTAPDGAASVYDDHITFRATTAFGQQLPSGAVMPFNLSACPDGWVAYGDGLGRVIVGADGAAYTVGATGGEETVSLSDNEAGFVPSTAGINPAAIPGTTQFAEPIGGSSRDAHENRPPYVALLFCEKA